MTRPLVLRRAEVGGEVVDVLVANGRVAAVGADVPAPGGAAVVEAGGGALLPGLHDHHLHLLATAAARASVDVGPARVRDRPSLGHRLRAHAASLEPGRWVRAVGYDPGAAGPIDRAVLDAAVADRPVRVQDRTGITWTLNTAALDALGLLGGGGLPPAIAAGVERGGDGAPTGRLVRLDAWLRDRLGIDVPDLADLGTDLTRCGVTGVTDASPFGDLTALDVLAAAHRSGALPQRITATGGVALAGAGPRFPAEVGVGPVKVVIDDHDLPSLDELAGWIAAAHRHGRPVAVHCVTRVQLLLALAAWDEAGARPGDRVEHGSVVPAESVARLAALGLAVVVQPVFVHDRGDRHLAEVDADDRGDLHRCAGLLAAGVAVAAGSDAPYGDVDPWASMRAAVGRRTAAGVSLGPGEAVSPEVALGLHLGPPEAPGGPRRRVAVGAAADLCLLAVPWRVARDRLRADDVAATVVGGRLVGGGTVGGGAVGPR